MHTVEPSRSRLAATLILAVCATLALPATGRSDREIAQLLEQFSDDKKAGRALEEVVGIGPPAVEQLRGLALEKQDVVKRGWAIAALSMIGGDQAQQTLQEISADSTEAALVREWALAGQINLAEDLDQLLKLHAASQGQGTLDRPFLRKLEALISSSGDNDIEALIKIAASNWQLGQTLGPRIVKLAPEQLVQSLWTSPDNNVRRTTASYLATQASSGQSQQVAKALLKAIRFEASAEEVPWIGGALFVPSITWPKGQARQFAEELMRWMLWADQKQKTGEVRQINNNLRSVGFSSQAGYGGRFGKHPRSWVQIWAASFGRAAAKELVISSGRAPKEFGQ
jgi:hypothetical protein